MSSLMDKLRKNSTIKETDVFSESKFFNEKAVIPTSVFGLNIALSGSITGGLTPGLTVIAGPSKHFKTLFALILLKAYLEKYPDAIGVFYDSEFGAPQSYFDNLGIDTSRILHIPITDIEQLKHDIMAQLTNIARGDHVFILIDSVGNLASKKEVEDALEQKSVADMTRAKQMKSLFRMVTPHLTIKDIPLLAINHTYKEMSLFPKDVVSGGTGIYYSADNILIIGRQQEKTADKELSGYNFIINIEKSRFVREKSKIGISVSFDGGINKWSGLLDIALEGGFVTNPKKGYFQRKGDEELYRSKETDTKEFWLPILSDKEFHNYVESKYKMSTSPIMSNLTDEDIDDEYENA